MVTWDLYLGILVYFVSSLGGVAIVKFLNYYFCFSSWLILALLSRATWILALILACSLGSIFRVSFKQLGIYFVIALGLSVVESFNAISMSVVPGSLYALIKGTDVFWSMLLSWLVLGKRYATRQILGVAIVLLGIAAVFGMGPPVSTAKHLQATQQAMQAAHVHSSTMAAVLCLVAAFINSFIAVITEATLKQTLRAEQESLAAIATHTNNLQREPSKLALSNEYAMWTSLLSFVILTGSAVVSGQLSQLSTDTGDLSSCSAHMNFTTSAETNANDAKMATPAPPHFMLWIFSLILITCSRFAERLCKHWICVRDSAMTFSLVQAARRLTGVFALAALFGEAFPRSMVVGTGLAGMGFALHASAGVVAAASPKDSRRPDACKEQEYQLVSLPPTEMDPAESDDEDAKA